MPVAAAIAPIAAPIIGAIAGGANKRPPSLDHTQQQALDSTIKSAQAASTGPATIDPTLQATAYDQNARSLTGANNQVDHTLAARGLTGSGIQASAIENNAAQSSANQTGINSNLQNQAIQQQNFNKDLIAKLTQTPNIPGQSTAGAYSAGAAGPLAYSLQQAALRQNGQSPANQNFSSAENNYLDTGNYS